MVTISFTKAEIQRIMEIVAGDMDYPEHSAKDKKLHDNIMYKLSNI